MNRRLVEGLLFASCLASRVLLATCTTPSGAGHATTTTLSGFGRRERPGSEGDCVCGRQDRQAGRRVHLHRRSDLGERGGEGLLFSDIPNNRI